MGAIPTDEVARQQYLQNNPKYHRVLRRWEIENYLFDKEVLKKYCDQNNLQFSEQDYNAFVTNICDQNLKDESNRMRNYCNIVGSVNSEAFKLNLAKVIDASMEVYKELERVIFNRE